LEILWKQELDNKNSMPFGYENNFLIRGSSILFACSFLDIENTNEEGLGGTKLVLYDFDKLTGEFTTKSISFKYQKVKEDKILLSRKWKYYFINDRLFLYIGKHLDISSEKIKVVPKNVDTNVSENNVQTEYVFKNKIVKYNGRMGLECLDNISGELIWKHRLKGYIYTKIEYKRNCLVFGTAGMGGALYCIELATGNIKRNISNGGAAHYDWLRDTIVITDTKYNLQQVDPYSNKTIDYLNLKDKMTGYSPIKVDGNRIYTVVFNKKNSNPSIVCIKTS
jgi:hypothetical protein